MLQMEYRTLSDGQLLYLFEKGDQVAYTEIYNRYFYLLYCHAYKKLRDEEQAKDIVQDLFATLWAKRNVKLSTGNLGGYLYTAVRNRIFDFFAHQKVESTYIQSLMNYISTVKSVATDSLVREKEFRACIEKEIQALPPKMRLIFELSRIENLSHQEIAAKLNISENNVSKQVNNALRVLRTKLGLILYIYFLIKF
jgi:RNA polymerase sigma-70 factor (family 1)